MKDFSSSIDRDRLRRIKKHATAQQCMDWLVDAGNFVRAVRQGKKVDTMR